MRTRYVISGEAMKKIMGRVGKTSLADRVEQAIAEEKLDASYFTSLVYRDELPGAVEEMKERGYADTLPSKDTEEGRRFREGLNGAYGEKEGCTWTINRQGQEEQEEVDPKDILFMMGHPLIEVLSPQELWEYERFGFNNITDFTGTLSAYIEQTFQDRETYGKGYIWRTRRAGGEIIETEITGDIHADLQVLQTDVTSYPTVDPAGNEVSYRPVTFKDHRILAAYHSTERDFLLGVLKYMDQQGIRSSVLGNLEKAVSWANSLGAKEMTCAEQFGVGDELPSVENRFFPWWRQDLPVLDEQGFYQEDSFRIRSFMVPTQVDLAAPFIDSKGNLVYAFDKSDPTHEVRNPEKPLVTFTPRDTDEVIKGILFQSAKGLGRTHLKRIIEVLMYRQSNDFQKELVANN